MSSLVCRLDVHENGVYATVMSYGGEVVEKRKLSNEEVLILSATKSRGDSCFHYGPL